MGERDTGRVEAFSDGVFAIAITLLILEIQLPHVAANASNRALVAGILALWPSAVALVLSFFVILVMWINHHELIRLVRRVDYSFLFANGFVLLLVTIVPFPTALLAQYLGTRRPIPRPPPIARRSWWGASRSISCLFRSRTGGGW